MYSFVFWDWFYHSNQYRFLFFVGDSERIGSEVLLVSCWRSGRANPWEGRWNTDVIIVFVVLSIQFWVWYIYILASIYIFMDMFIYVYDMYIYIYTYWPRYDITVRYFERGHGYMEVLPKSRHVSKNSWWVWKPWVWWSTNYSVWDTYGI